MFRQMTSKLALLTSVALIAGCSSGYDYPESDSGVEKGYVIDSPIEGIAYEFPSGRSGISGIGGFIPVEGESSVVLSIAGISVTHQITDSYLFVADFDLPEAAIVNLARVLLVLDEDGDSSNGIQIPQEVIDEGFGLSLDELSLDGFDTSVSARWALDHSERAALVSVEDAQQHLADTKASMDSGDFDGDGTADETDNCPTITNASQDDLDNDGIGDACDAEDNRDLDNDGVVDLSDNCPADANSDQADTDNDGTGDVCDAVDNTDSDTDSVRDAIDNCPADSNSDQADTDGDGIGDVCDLVDNGDTDSDTVENHADNCPADANSDQADVDGDGIGDVCDPQDNRDSDTDSVEDHIDNCPVNSNGDQSDIDGDGIGDVCDLLDNRDTDRDGIQNHEDNCPADVNGDQTDVDGDGAGDVCDASDNRDSDFDGVENHEDNCVAESNPNQADFDVDGIGDVCDTEDNNDDDNDGHENFIDNCPAVSNPNQEDTDGDGVGDVCDTVANTDHDSDGVEDAEDNCPSASNADQTDTDLDGEGDACDAPAPVALDPIEYGSKQLHLSWLPDPTASHYIVKRIRAGGEDDIVTAGETDESQISIPFSIVRDFNAFYFIESCNSALCTDGAGRSATERQAASKHEVLTTEENSNWLLALSEPGSAGMFIGTQGDAVVAHDNYDVVQHGEVYPSALFMDEPARSIAAFAAVDDNSEVIVAPVADGDSVRHIAYVLARDEGSPYRYVELEREVTLNDADDHYLNPALSVEGECFVSYASQGGLIMREGLAGRWVRQSKIDAGQGEHSLKPLVLDDSCTVAVGRYSESTGRSTIDIYQAGVSGYTSSNVGSFSFDGKVNGSVTITANGDYLLAPTTYPNTGAHPDVQVYGLSRASLASNYTATHLHSITSRRPHDGQAFGSSLLVAKMNSHGEHLLAVAAPHDRELSTGVTSDTAPLSDSESVGAVELFVFDEFGFEFEEGLKPDALDTGSMFGMIISGSNNLADLYVVENAGETDALSVDRAAGYADKRIVYSY